ncbi:MAG: hypothetical protein AAB410_01770 [Patescibacteria group bacterium]
MIKKRVDILTVSAKILMYPFLILLHGHPLPEKCSARGGQILPLLCGDLSPPPTAVCKNIIPPEAGRQEAAASPPPRQTSNFASNFAKAMSDVPKASSDFQKAMADTVKIQFQGFL